MQPTLITGDAAFAAGVPLSRVDGATDLFLDRELEKIDPSVFEQRKPALNFAGLIPVKSDFQDWQTKYTYRSVDSLGKASFVGQKAHDFPIVNASRAEHTSNILAIGAAVQYDSRELAAASAQGFSLDSALFAAAARAIEEKVNKIAFEGDDESGLHGLFSHPGTLKLAAGNALASATSAANNLVELNKLANTAPDSTGQVEAPDVAILPPDSYQAVSQQQRAAGTDTTTLSFWLGTNGYIGEARSLRECRNASIPSGGSRSTSDVAASFKRDPMVMELLYSGIKRLPAMQVGPLCVQIPFVAYFGGLVIRHPKSVLILTGV